MRHQVSGRNRLAWVRRAAVETKSRLAGNPALRRLYYRFWNSTAFADAHWHEVMLADRVRVETYRRAIEATIGPNDVVLDLGSGTGILACMAARAGARRVYAVEHSPIADLAEEVIAHNGLSQVEVVRTHSSRFTPDERPTVILHEQIGNSLVDEDMVRNIVDLRDRVLAPGGSILPAQFSLLVCPVSLRSERRVAPLGEEVLGSGIDFSCLRKPSGFDADDYRPIGIEPADVEAVHGRPGLLMAFDLHDLDPDTLPREHACMLEVDRPGVIDGWCVFFRVGFGAGIELCAGPESPRTHWGCRLLRTPGLSVRTRDRFRFVLHTPDLARASGWSFTSARQ